MGELRRLHVTDVERVKTTTNKNVLVREPWRLATGYHRCKRINVEPKRDSPLWVMSVNRVNWPAYQKMMTGFAHTVAFQPSSPQSVCAKHLPDYPPPLVPPVELEILYDNIPLDHSWGDGKNPKARMKQIGHNRTPAVEGLSKNTAKSGHQHKRRRRRRPRRRTKKNASSPTKEKVVTGRSSAQTLQGSKEKGKRVQVKAPPTEK